MGRLRAAARNALVSPAHTDGYGHPVSYRFARAAGITRVEAILMISKST